MHNPKNILITGGKGFIGTNFINYILLKYKNQKIINLDKLTYAANINIIKNKKYKFVKGDISNKKLVYEILLKYNIDTIVNFAAETHVDNSIKTPRLFINSNISGVFNLIEAANQYYKTNYKKLKNNFRFHQISTDEVYGSLKLKEKPFTEKSSYKPNSPYSASKAGADHIIRSYYKTYNLPITISTCSNNYGPFQNSEKLIPKIIYNCINRKEIPIYGNGLNIRDWIYVDDHCDAIYKILKYGKIGETYNVGSNNELKNIEIVKLICKIINSKYDFRNDNLLNLITFVKDRPGHDFRYSINSNKIRKKLNWRPKVKFTFGLKKTINWYFNQLNKRI